MTDYTIKLAATSAGRDVDELANKFYDEFDGMAALRCGEWSLTVVEYGHDPRKLAIDAIRKLEDIGFSIVRVDEDLVDIPEIAERLKRSRQAVHKWASKEVGSSFPRPHGSPGGKRIWPWFEVLDWYRINKDSGAPRGLVGDDAAYVDSYLAARRDQLAPYSGLRVLGNDESAKRDNAWPAAVMEYWERPLVVGLMAGTDQ